MSDPTATVSTKTTTEHPASTRRGAVCSPRFHARRMDSGTQNPGTGGLEHGTEGAGKVRSAVTDEEFDVLEQQHGVHVQEVDRDDPGGLGVQELPPGRA